MDTPNGEQGGQNQSAREKSARDAIEALNGPTPKRPCEGEGVKAEGAEQLNSNGSRT